MPSTYTSNVVPENDLAKRVVLLKEDRVNKFKLAEEEEKKKKKKKKKQACRLSRGRFPLLPLLPVPPPPPTPPPIGLISVTSTVSLDIPQTEVFIGTRSGLDLHVDVTSAGSC
ncbi:hypothetical protein M0802_009567 [Mischocyttarus mexicanus]|nr:hypothetical protein M0802_009567 [Mischocyttarus mexicanus]